MARDRSSAMITLSHIRQSGQVATFFSLVHWKEAYVTENKETKVPNKMWKKMPYGQLVKCTEANGLRKAYPDSVASLPTYEEMGGKTELINVEEIKPIPTHKNKILSVEELQQRLAGSEPIVLEKKESVMAMNDKIKSTKTPEELNQLAEEIQNGNYSEEDKDEIRKIFKQKKKSLKQTTVQ